MKHVASPLPLKGKVVPSSKTFFLHNWLFFEGDMLFFEVICCFELMCVGVGHSNTSMVVRALARKSLTVTRSSGPVLSA
jgi:hypothetical protein